MAKINYIFLARIQQHTVRCACGKSHLKTANYEKIRTELHLIFCYTGAHQLEAQVVVKGSMLRILC